MQHWHAECHRARARYVVQERGWSLHVANLQRHGRVAGMFVLQAEIIRHVLQEAARFSCSGHVTWLTQLLSRHEAEGARMTGTAGRSQSKHRLKAFDVGTEVETNATKQCCKWRRQLKA